MRPLCGRVLIQVDPEAEKEIVKDGIVLPQIAKDPPVVGRVAAIADNTMEVKIGDKVLFPKFGGVEVKIGGKTYMMFKECELLAVLDGKA